jgi:hypothetical protein
MWRHLRPERVTTSFQMRHSQGMTFPIALSTSPSSPSCVSAPHIGLVPHWKANSPTFSTAKISRFTVLWGFFEKNFPQKWLNRLTKGAINRCKRMEKKFCFYSTDIHCNFLLETNLQRKSGRNVSTLFCEATILQRCYNAFETVQKRSTCNEMLSKRSTCNETIVCNG